MAHVGWYESHEQVAMNIPHIKRRMAVLRTADSFLADILSALLGFLVSAFGTTSELEVLLLSWLIDDVEPILGSFRSMDRSRRNIIMPTVS